ncbi:hypothetical protein BJY01DRAFT_208524 [Aspergillus pseudoustus]|uniref:Uncharacterized protein n=1 Tax=Aspergillus pseudoustus TaxID=1810923 RepID=A0ABR4KI31_9EURO
MIQHTNGRLRELSVTAFNQIIEEPKTLSIFRLLPDYENELYLKLLWRSLFLRAMRSLICISNIKPLKVQKLTRVCRHCMISF